MQRAMRPLKTLEDTHDVRMELFTNEIMPHKGMIYDICIKYSYKQRDIEDNYNYALATLFRFADMRKDDKPLKTWIYITVVRCVFEANKRNAKILFCDNISVESISDNLHSTPNSYTCMGMENYRDYYSDAVLQALDTLSPKHREALLLQMAGYQISEIVEISFQNGNLRSKSCQTIKSRIFLAKKQMRELLSLNPEFNIEGYE